MRGLLVRLFWVATVAAVGCGVPGEHEFPGSTPVGGTRFDDAPASAVRIRFLNALPHLDAVADVCWKAPGGAFEGPALARKNLRAGLAYAQMSPYMVIEAGDHVFRFVPPNSADCSVSIPRVSDVPLKIDPAVLKQTIVVAPDTTNKNPRAPIVKVFADENAPPADGALARFIDASADLSKASLGITVDGKNFTQIFDKIAYMEAPAARKATLLLINERGYVKRDAPVDLQVIVQDEQGNELLQTSNFKLDKSFLMSLFLIGLKGDATFPLSLLACFDHDQRSVGNSVCFPTALPAVATALTANNLGPTANVVR
jgi:hypothetical protein